MKRNLLMCLLSLLVMATGCKEEDGLTAVQLVSITSETFTYKGGLGSAVVNTDGQAVVAESSDPEWCRVQVMENTVLFNVTSYTGNVDRAATLTIQAQGMTPLAIEITQTRFQGLIVTPTTLTFSEEQRELSVLVTASEDYEVSFTENPNDLFSFKKELSGVTFICNKAPGRVAQSGRAQLTPTDGGEPVIITLIQPQKTVYDYLIGSWEVISNTANDRTVYLGTMDFRAKENQYSYYVTITPLGSNYPFVAEFVNGKVKISCGQQLGIREGGFLTLHFNGPIDGQGNYIFTGAGAVAWEAEPLFDEAAGTITLRFVDNGQGLSKVANWMAIWSCSGNYFNFGSGSPLATFQNLAIVKSYTE